MKSLFFSVNEKLLKFENSSSKIFLRAISDSGPWIARMPKLGL